ncbi:MAG: hypothetical protein CMD43_05890 [Gammaproteobacteria bacterium]|nr:hypothetical protein [Gammaproteobacteria bacterium]|tara:strand:+ start:59 stop:748 length:690 start_codon:yes stop_codon:yes gene_type:complete
MIDNKKLSVIILCGGEGMRLRPLTNNIPKPLVQINDKPILFYIINHLLKYQISDYIIATGYKSEKIEDFMNINFNNLNYRIVNSGNVDIISRVKDSLKYINDDFILCYGDTISDIDINDLIKHHSEHNNLNVISSYPIKIPFGVMKLDRNIVNEFTEKPVLNDVMNIGYYYFNSSSFDIINNESSLIDVINKLISKKLLTCYQHQGIHITVNTLAELETANNNIKKILK